MTFGTDDCQTACCFYFRTQLDVRTTTGHVCSNGYRTAQTCFSNDVCLPLVKFRIQYVVFDLAHGQHLAQHLGDFYRSSTHQYRASCLYQLFYFFDYGFILFAFCFVNAVIHVFAGNRSIGRNHDYIQFVNVPQLTGFCFGRTGHTREFMIHTEVVLQSDGGKSLCGSFYFHTFLRFDGLMQSV